jgi:hypothetical protein
MVSLIDFDRRQDCAKKTNELWGHDLLQHNQAELKRMRSSVKPFLFVGI